MGPPTHGGSYALAFKLTNSNTRDRITVSRGRCAAHRIAPRSKSTFYGLLTASLILPTCTTSYAFAHEPGPAATPQGSSGRKAVIEVRTSPEVYLPGPSFRTEVTSTKPVTHQVPELIQQGIEQTLLRNDPRLRVASGTPDTAIVCTITDLSVSPGVESRVRQEYRKTGETTVTDPQPASRTEDQYSYVDVPYPV
jgi:hypothetical protein